MSDLLFELNNYLNNVLGLFGPIVSFLQIIAVGLIIFFLWKIIFFVKELNKIGSKVDAYSQKYIGGEVGKKKVAKGWRDIVKKFQTKKEEDYKSAIADADKILSEILKMSGFPGETINAKLANITEAEIANIEELKQAHLIGEKVALDPTFELSFEDALKTIRIYKKTFQDFSIIE